MTEKRYPVPVDKQSNIITSARYNYTLIEKRIIYYILIHIKKNNSPDQDLKIKMPLNEILKQGELRQIKKAAKSLRQKSFVINKTDYWAETGFINNSIIEKGILQVELSELILPYLLDLDNNFTRFSAYTATILKSVYTQRLYELCCRFRDTGKYRVTVEELKKMMMIEDKYDLYGSFKHNVLEVAQKELQELYINNESDIMFTYDEIKTGRQITDLQFNIKNKEKNRGAEESTTDQIHDVMNYIILFWPQSETRQKQIFNEINRKKAFKEFLNKADQIVNRKNNKGKAPHLLGGMLTKALREDLQLDV